MVRAPTYSYIASELQEPIRAAKEVSRIARVEIVAADAGQEAAAIPGQDTPTESAPGESAHPQSSSSNNAKDEEPPIVRNPFEVFIEGAEPTFQNPKANPGMQILISNG